MEYEEIEDGGVVGTWSVQEDGTVVFDSTGNANG